MNGATEPERIALVIGASRGIGAAAARALAGAGHAVAIVCLSRRKEAEAVLAECGGRGATFLCDVRDPAAVHGLVRDVEAKLGPVAVAVHSPNLSFPIGPFWQQPWPEVKTKLDQELGAFHALASAVVPGMIARRFGRLILVSSMMSRHPSPGFATHAAAKSALDAAVLTLARELGVHGVTANIVAPGVVESASTATIAPEVRAWVERATPGARLGVPDDLGQVIAWLASDAARWVTGQYLQMDGGLGGSLPFASDAIIRQGAR